jgi:hypothetical protein
MSFDISKEVEKALRESTSYEDMRQTLHNAASAQKITLAHRWEENPTAVNTSATNGFARDTSERRERDAQGRFTDSSEAGLANQISQATQVAEVLQEETATRTTVQETDEQRIMRQTELELAFKRGTISTAEYLEKSGAVEQFLESHGVSLPELASTLQEAQAQQLTQSWESAVSEFLSSPEGRSWPGGEKNLTLISLQLQNLGLVDAPDKVVALAQAYQHMQSRGLLFSPEADAEAERAAELAAVQEAISSATDPTQIRLAMEEYKSRVAETQDPNSAFTKTFARDGDKAVYRPARPSGESSGIFGR